ncbi:MAG: hypothetical protein WBC51_09155 [Vicinamibacterales bacterium]
MGKRELLLIVAFVIVGAVVYQATAPPAGPNERRFSLSKIVDHLRREMRGNRARAEETKVIPLEITATTTEIRVAGFFVELSVTGENRAGVEARFHVSSNGYDEAEAKSLVGQTQLIVDRAGPVLRLTSKYPQGGRQEGRLTLLVPARLVARIDQGSPRTSILNLAGVEMPNLRGETSIKHISGRVTLTHRAGRLLIEDVATLKLTTRGSDVTVTNVKADASFAVQSGELTATSLGGPIDVESQSSSVTLRKLEDARGPLRVNAVGGSITLDGLAGDARIDGRNAEIDITMAKAATIAVYSEGDEPIQLTPPPGGFTLDAVVSHGRLALPEGFDPRVTVAAAENDSEQRANGAVRGGGPTITLRANRGDIRIRPREVKTSQR